MILVPGPHPVRTTDSKGVVRAHQCSPNVLLLCCYRKWNRTFYISKEGLCLSWWTPTAFVQCGGWESFQETGSLCQTLLLSLAMVRLWTRDLTSLCISFLIFQNNKTTHLLELLWHFSELTHEKHSEQCWVSGKWLKNISYLLSFKTQFKCTWRFSELASFLGSFSTLVMPLLQHWPCYVIIINLPILSH